MLGYAHWGKTCIAMILERSYFHEAESDGRFSLEICSLQVIYRTLRSVSSLVTSVRVDRKITKKAVLSWPRSVSSTYWGKLSMNSGAVCHLHLIKILSHFNHENVYSLKFLRGNYFVVLPNSAQKQIVADKFSWSSF